MTLDDDIDISDEEPDADKIKEEKVNGLTEEEGEIENSTSDIEDNDIRETLSDDSDKIKVK